MQASNTLVLNQQMPTVDFENGNWMIDIDLSLGMK